MAIYNVDNVLAFPAPELAEDDGLLAMGGDLSLERLKLAYRMGIFPWFTSENPILWWSPDPRMVLFPTELHIAKSMRSILRNPHFTVTADQAFYAVISACQQVPRMHQDGTWITDSIIEAYLKLHLAGWAHSIEVWQQDELVGGLYGVAVGKVFCGESMFARRSNASKLAFIRLTQKLAKEGYAVIDCQMYTEHLASLGAREIPRSTFLKYLPSTFHDLSEPSHWGDWNWA